LEALGLVTQDDIEDALRAALREIAPKHYKGLFPPDQASEELVCRSRAFSLHLGFVQSQLSHVLQVRADFFSPGSGLISRFEEDSPMTCAKCGKTMKSGLVEFDETIRGKQVSVTFQGFACPACGFRVVDMKHMAGYGRRVSDEYRRSEGLLTSDEVRAAREGLAMSQDAFADYLGVGIASVKRWELGQIQERSMDKLIRLMTDPAYALAHAVALQGRLPPSVPARARLGKVRGAHYDALAFSENVRWPRGSTGQQSWAWTVQPSLGWDAMKPVGSQMRIEELESKYVA
jgi:putative zinc finger/helix-turn-helix YgiT family protein